MAVDNTQLPFSSEYLLRITNGRFHFFTLAVNGRFRFSSMTAQGREGEFVLFGSCLSRPGKTEFCLRRLERQQSAEQRPFRNSPYETLFAAPAFQSHYFPMSGIAAKQSLTSQALPTGYGRWLAQSIA